ncbi:unnamed protein product, partial [Closterium sp. NIES-64]
PPSPPCNRAMLEQISRANQIIFALLTLFSHSLSPPSRSSRLPLSRTLGNRATLELEQILRPCAMLELEQILRANQINFALLTALPALLLLSGLFSLSRDFSARGAEGKGRMAQTRRRMLLADVERHVLLRNHLRVSPSSKALPPAQSFISTSAAPSTSASAPLPGSTSVSTLNPSSAPCDDVASSANDVSSLDDVAVWHGMLVYLLHRLYVAVQRQASKEGEWSRLQQDILDIASPHMDMQGRQLLATRMATVYDCLVPLAK